MALTIGVLAVQGDVREHEAALARVGVQPVRVKSEAQLAGLDGLVVPGGESTTIGKLAILFDLMGPLQELVAQGLPVFGSCAGMILLADELLDDMPNQPTIGGLDVAVRRNAFGSQIASFECDLAIEAIGKPDFRAVFIRAPWVETLGVDVQVMATVSDSLPPDTSLPEANTGRVVAVRQGALLATAFHPELAGDDRLHGYFADIVRGQV